VPEVVDVLNVKPDLSPGVVSEAPRSKLSPSEIAQPYELMGRALNSWSRGMEEGAGAFERSATAGAEQRAQIDVANARVTRDANGQVQVLNPPSGFGGWGEAGRAYQDALNKGLAARVVNESQQALTDIHTRNPLDAEGFRKGSDAFINQLQAQSGNTVWGAIAVNHARGLQAEHIDSIARSTMSNDVANSKESLLTNLEQQKASYFALARGEGLDTDKARALQGSIGATLNGLTTNPIFKYPKDRANIEMNGIVAQAKGWAVTAHIDNTYNKNPDGKAAAQRELEKVRDDPTLPPGEGLRLYGYGMAHLEQLTGEAKADVVFAERNAELIAKQTAQDPNFVNSAAFQDAMGQAKAAHADKAIERLQGLQDQYGYVKSVGSLPQAQRQGIMNEHPFAGPTSFFEPHKDFRGFVPSQTVYDALVAKGFTPNAARGLLGNLMFESGGGSRGGIYLNPPTDAGRFNWGTGDAAVGAAQWEGRRQGGIAPTLQSQVDKIWEEFNNPSTAGMQAGALQRLQAARSPGEAAEIVNAAYERPQRPGASAVARRQYAYMPLSDRGGGAPPEAVAGGGYHLTSEQVLRHPSSLTAYMESLESDPESKSSYISSRVDTMRDAVRAGVLPSMGSFAEVQKDIEGDPRYAEGGKYWKIGADFDHVKDAASVLVGGGGPGAPMAAPAPAREQFEQSIRDALPGAGTYALRRGMQTLDTLHEMEKNAKNISGLASMMGQPAPPSIDGANWQTIPGALAQRGVLAQHLGVLNGTGAPAILEPGDMPKMQAVLQGPHGGELLTGILAQVAPSDVQRLVDQAEFRDAVVGMTRSGNPQSMNSAFGFLDKMRRDNPVDFEKFGTNAARDLALWTGLAAYKDPKEAIEIMNRAYDPAEESARKALDKQADVNLAPMTAGAVLNLVSGRTMGFGGASPPVTAPGETFMSSVMRDEWAENYKFMFRYSNDDKMSQGYATERLNSVWGQSAISGGAYMKRPPEKYYGPVGGNYAYMPQQLNAEVKAYSEQIGKPVTGAITLHADARTDEDLTNHVPPSYKILAQGADGWHVIPGGDGLPKRFSFSVQNAQADFMEAMERGRQSRAFGIQPGARVVPPITIGTPQPGNILTPGWQRLPGDVGRALEQLPPAEGLERRGGEPIE
jgi:Phage tail lysozyme